MKRNINNIKNHKFDVLIIGGGIHGATLAYELAKNGLKLCLIDQSDFGSKTSANSLKVLHGGLRYLQHANIKRIRESIYSRKVFQQIAPHLVKNVPFLIPTFGVGLKSKFALRMAFAMYELLSYDKNQNISPECNIPKGYIISKKELRQIISDKGVLDATGGAVWYETIATNTERLLFEFLHCANNYDAEFGNYLEAKKYEIKNNTVTGVWVEDKIKSDEFIINADVVINTVGPWLNNILMGTDDYEQLKTPLAKAVNIVVKKNFYSEFAVGLESIREFEDTAALIKKGKRLFFFVPLGNYTMIGTTYKLFNENPNKLEIYLEDIKEIISEVNSISETANLTIEDVTQTHVGLQATPAIDFKNDFDVQPETHSLIFDHSSEGKIKNLISVKSVKYTTAPSIAKSISNIILQKDTVDDIINTQNTEIQKKIFFEQNSKTDEDLLSRLWNTYGHKANTVIEFIMKNEQSQKFIFEKEKITLGEIEYCIENEMAITASDILDRRIGLSSLQKLDNMYYQKIEEVLANKNNYQV